MGGVCVFGGAGRVPASCFVRSDGVPQYAVLVAVANDPVRAEQIVLCVCASSPAVAGGLATASGKTR